MQHSERSAVLPESGMLKAHREHQLVLAGLARTKRERSCCILKEETTVMHQVGNLIPEKTDQCRTPYDYSKSLNLTPTLTNLLCLVLLKLF